ncbi:hypothetical protein [Kitasatospora sp. CB01950]|uniref:hypothetical protein n=1 Tax=Kitasatospora sp. CB01950 TaxID=1703930 RepID=UPI00093C8BBA|nr:hypothetical protein [Kitasatospora sp. CB01950]OKI99211.1 hypothetical protein AMK19_31095 [Kitasatospora sp. CB01950]
MKKLTALAALTLSGLALGATPAAAATPILQVSGLDEIHGMENGYLDGMPPASELCHRDLANYPIVGETVDRTTGVCEALGASLDRH